MGLDRQCRGLGGLDVPANQLRILMEGEDAGGHTIGQVFLLIHQPITEHALLNDCSRKVRCTAEGQVCYCRIDAESTFDCDGKWCAGYLAWAAQGDHLGWEAIQAGRKCISHIV